jgi:Arc/MetJ family transcription regulator
MPTTIVFTDDRANARSQIRVDEDPADVAAAIERTSIPKLTVKGAPVWVNAASIRMLKEPGGVSAAAKRSRRTAAEGRPARKGRRA